MSPVELRAARQSLGLSIVELAQVLDVSERTIRVWEKGHYKHRPAVVPHVAGLVLRLAVKYAVVRRELGLSIDGAPR
jgi:DNA-binding XRE family transcriptional regulator